MRARIDSINDWVYHGINNGVYKSGFAQTQVAYDAAVGTLFECLDRLEDILSKQRYVASTAAEGITEADVRAFVTAVRFDEVYVVYFKCNKRSLSSYPSIRGWMREMYQMDAVKATTSMYHIKAHRDDVKPFIRAPLECVIFGPLIPPRAMGKKEAAAAADDSGSDSKGKAV